MSASMSLAHMVDLALGTPEVGAVNFTVLHTLLHAVLQKLNLTEVTADIQTEDKDFLTKQKDDTEQAGQDGVSASPGKDGQHARDGTESDSGVSATERGSSAESVPIKRRAPYHQLQDKVNRLEQQLDALNNLPSNADLFERSKAAKGDQVSPVADMWQGMQLKKKVDTNEEGIGKVNIRHTGIHISESTPERLYIIFVPSET